MRNRGTCEKIFLSRSCYVIEIVTLQDKLFLSSCVCNHYVDSGTCFHWKLPHTAEPHSPHYKTSGFGQSTRPGGRDGCRAMGCQVWEDLLFLANVRAALSRLQQLNLSLERGVPKPALRAQILKTFKILKFSSEIDNFKRATHQTPTFCGEFWRSGLKTSSEIEIFKRD